MLIYIGFIVIIFVLIEQYFRNKRFGMLYFKNDHLFSIVVAIREPLNHLDKLFETARKSKHQWIFININDSINVEEHPNITYKNLWVDKNPLSIEYRAEVLAKAYSLGYDDAKENFLLFMDGSIQVRNNKTLDFMANNLVEHQVYTLKPTVYKEKLGFGHDLFFDVLANMNYEKNDINFEFHAIKKDTYKLAGCDLKEYQTISSYEEDIFKKNISITHVNHAESFIVEPKEHTFKARLNHAIDSIVHAERLKGLSIMMLFIIALHFFYIAFIIDFNVLPILFYMLIHLLIYVVYQPFLKHHLLSIFLAPLYVIYFDFVLLFALIKRTHVLSVKRNPARQVKDDVPLELKDTTNEKKSLEENLEDDQKKQEIKTDDANKNTIENHQEKKAPKEDKFHE